MRLRGKANNITTHQWRELLVLHLYVTHYIDIHGCIGM